MKIYQIIIASSLSLITSVGFAEEKAPVHNDVNDVNNEVSDFKNSFYLGGRMGASLYNDACGPDNISCNNDKLGLGIYGGYNFTKWFGVEAALTDYGKPEANYDYGNVKSHLSSTELSGVFTYEVSENWSAYTRLGASYLFIDKDSPSRGRESLNSLNGLVALGLKYKISSGWTARAEYEYIDGIGADEIGQANLGFASVGITYTFSQSIPPEVKEVKEVQEVQEVMIRFHESSQKESLFQHNSSIVNVNSRLISLMIQLRDGDGKMSAINIIGYADSTGAEAYNLIISEKRASHVKDYLVQNGIKADRISVEGKGEKDPIASNNSANGREQNRRVEISFEVIKEAFGTVSNKVIKK